MNNRHETNSPVAPPGGSSALLAVVVLLLIDSPFHSVVIFRLQTRARSLARAIERPQLLQQSQRTESQYRHGEFWRASALNQTGPRGVNQSGREVLGAEALDVSSNPNPRREVLRRSSGVETLVDRDAQSYANYSCTLSFCKLNVHEKLAYDWASRSTK